MEIETAVQSACERLFGEVVAADSIPDANRSDVNTLFDNLAREASELMTQLSDGHVENAREQLKTQQKGFELKLDHSRTGVKVQLQNQAAEMEATHEKVMGEKIESLLNGGDSALKEAWLRAEAADAALTEVRLKLEGTEQAFTLAQSRLKTAEGRLETLEAEAAHTDGVLSTSRKMLVAEQKALKLLRDPEAEVDAIVRDVIGAYEERKVALASAEEMLKAALEGLGVRVEPGMSMDKQMGALIARLEEEKSGRMAALNKVNDLELAAEASQEERDGLADERDAAVDARERMRAEAQEMQAKLAGVEGKARAKQDQLDKQLAEAASVERELASARNKLETTAAENARLVEIQAGVDEIERQWRAKVDAEAQKAEAARAAQQAAEDAGAEEAAKRQKLEDEFEASAALIADLRETVADKDRDIAEHAQKMDEMRSQVAETQKSMDQLLSQGNGESAQTNYWKGETDKQKAAVAKLEQDVLDCRKMLQDQLKKLQVTLVAKDSLESELTALLKDYKDCKDEVSRMQKQVEKTSRAFKLSRKSKDDLQDQLQTLLNDYERCKDDLARFQGRLSATMGDLNQKVAANATLEEHLNALVDEHEGCKRQVYDVLAPLSSAKCVGRARKQMKIAAPLAEMLSTLIDLNYAAQFAKEASEKVERRAQRELVELRARVGNLEASASEQVRSAVEVHKKERNKIVRTALSSLQQLRSHVAVELTGEREAPGEEVREEEFVFNNFKNRWGVQTEGKFNQIVVRVEGLQEKQTAQKMRQPSRPATSPRPPQRAPPNVLVPPSSPPRSPAALPRLRDAPGSTSSPQTPLAVHRPLQVRPPMSSTSLHGSALSRGALSAREQTVGNAPLEFAAEAQSAPLSARWSKERRNSKERHVRVE